MITTRTDVIHCMECGWPWGTLMTEIEPVEDAVSALSAAWEEYFTDLEIALPKMQTHEETVIQITEAGARFIHEHFDAGPEPGWWTVDSVLAYDTPRWFVDSRAHHRALLTICGCA